MSEICSGALRCRLAVYFSTINFDWSNGQRSVVLTTRLGNSGDTLCNLLCEYSHHSCLV